MLALGAASGRESQVHVEGDLAALLAAFAAVGYLEIGRRLRTFMPIFVYAFAITSFAATAVTLSSLALEGSSFTASGESGTFGYLTSKRYAPLVAYLAVGPGIVGHTGYNTLLKYLTPLLLALTLQLEPLLGSVMGWFAGVTAAPGPLTFAGGALVLVAAVLVTAATARREQREERRREAALAVQQLMEVGDWDEEEAFDGGGSVGGGGGGGDGAQGGSGAAGGQFTNGGGGQSSVHCGSGGGGFGSGGGGVGGDKRGSGPGVAGKGEVEHFPSLLGKVGSESEGGVGGHVNGGSSSSRWVKGQSQEQYFQAPQQGKADRTEPMFVLE